MQYGEGIIRGFARGEQIEVTRGGRERLGTR